MDESCSHLEDVVLSDGRNDPVIVRVPRKVGDLRGVTSVNEEELRGAVLGVLGGLLRPDPAEVPDHEPPVRAAGRQDRLVLRRPRHLEDLVRVALKEVELGL